MKTMGKIMPATIKRMLIYLVLGFGMSFVVVWALAFMPHGIGPGRHSYSQRMSGRSSSSGGTSFFLFDSRWIGVWELQYSKHSQVTSTRRIGATEPPMQLWWAWEPLKKIGTPPIGFLDLEDTFTELETQPDAESDPEQSTQATPKSDMLSYAEIKYGWPVLSHRVLGGYNESNTNADNSFKSKIQGGVGLPMTHSGAMSRFIAFPYRPIWTGLMINTLFWALIFAGLLSIKRAYRHARRMRRGRCPMCSYDLEFVFVDGCPECGWRKTLQPPQ